MEQFDSSCYNSVSNWLNVYLFETTAILIFLVFIILPACSDDLFMFVQPFQYYVHCNDESVDSRFLLSILLELALMVVYIFCALIVRWTFNIGPVTQWWLIETCYGPIITEIFVYLIYRYPCIEESDIEESYHVKFPNIAKLILFLIKRYQEFYPSSNFNNMKIRAFYVRCDLPIRYNNSNLDFSKFPFYHF